MRNSYFSKCMTVSIFATYALGAIFLANCVRPYGKGPVCRCFEIPPCNISIHISRRVLFRIFGAASKTGRLGPFHTAKNIGLGCSIALGPCVHFFNFFLLFIVKSRFLQAMERERGGSVVSYM